MLPCLCDCTLWFLRDLLQTIMIFCRLFLPLGSCYQISAHDLIFQPFRWLSLPRVLVVKLISPFFFWVQKAAQHCGTVQTSTRVPMEMELLKARSNVEEHARGTVVEDRFLRLPYFFLGYTESVTKIFLPIDSFDASKETIL